MVSFQGEDIIFSSNNQESTYTLSKMTNNRPKKIEQSAYKKELLEWYGVFNSILIPKK